MKMIRTCLIAAALTCGLLGPAAAKPVADAAPTTVTLDSCAWDRPGHNPFMGDVVAAVDRYRDIPPEVRARLKARMAKRDYDDLVSIRRDSITGRAKYGASISDMHFGTHQVCHSVTRAAWSAGMQERGLVYCESGQCVLVPTVCRNVSRISRAASAPEHAVAPDDPAVEAASVAVPEGGPLTDPAATAPATPLAMDESPSFASPRAWQGFVGVGSPTGGGVPAGSAAGLPDLPTVSASSVPPGGSDSPVPITLAPVPEPQTWALMLGGLTALAAWRRRRIRP